jgi:hypothetical protein
MAEKVIKPLGGFDVLADFIVGKDPTKFNAGMPNDDKDGGGFRDIDPDDLKTILSDDNKTDDKTVVIPPVEPKEPKVPVEPKEPKTTKTPKEPKEPVAPVVVPTEPVAPIEPTDDDKEYESEISSFFAGQFAKKLNLDIPEEDLKFEKIDDVLDLMSEIVAENSKPVYASDEVEAYDEFVRNGGSLKDFYKEVYAGKLDPTSIDIEKEYDQRAVVRENLLNQGYKEDKIKKMISRYEEAETLKEEAEDALDLVKEFNQKKAESLLVQQKKDADAARKQQQRFFEDVNSTIKSISNIKGFPITEKEKRELLQYAFNPEEDGLSKYQKEYRSDVMNILESAYFAMNRKKNLNIADLDASKKGNSDAYKTLRDRLKAKGNKAPEVDNGQKSNNVDRGSLGDFGRGIIF